MKPTEQVNDDQKAPTSGFRAYLENVSLPTLLQIESLSHTTGVFRIAAAGGVGQLHLRAGELVHAESPSAEGEEAVLEILGWGEGRFQTLRDEPTETRTVHTSLDALLLRAAKEADEAEHAGEPKPLPPRPRPSSRTLRSGLTAARPVESAEPSWHVPTSSPGRSITDAVLSAKGEVLQSRGPGPADFAARVAYAARLAELIGMAMSSGQPQAIRVGGHSTTMVVCRLPDGNLVASLSHREGARALDEPTGVRE